MIIKTLSRKSGAGSIINYLFKEERKVMRDNGKPLIFRHNLRTRKQENWIKEFKENEALRLHRRKDSVQAYHTILSFSNKDRDLIDEQVLKDIAKKYMELRGRDKMYIGTAHRDKDHVHIHLVESGTKYLTGQSSRISKAKFKELKLNMDAYQQKKYPELVHSLPEHDSTKAKEQGQNESEIPKPDKRATEKDQLLNSLELAYNKANSLESFLSEIQAKGYAPYYRGGKLAGVQSENNRKFRLERLGYDNEHLDKLDAARMEEEKDLEELQSIRSQSEERSRDDSERTMEDDDRDEQEDDNEEDADDGNDDI